MTRFLIAAFLGLVFGIIVSQISIQSLNSLFADSEHPRPSSWREIATPFAIPGLLLASDPQNGVENYAGDGIDNHALPWIFAGNGIAWAMLGTVGFFAAIKLPTFFATIRHAR